MAKKQQDKKWQEAYNSYCFNLFRHLTFIDRHLHQQLINNLEKLGYRGQNIHYIRVIPYLGEQGGRATDLARSQQIPKQTMAKLVNELCEKKYIVKKDDPHDSRAKRLFVAKRGLSLIADALRIAGELELSLQEKLGTEDFKAFVRNVDLAFSALRLSYPPVSRTLELSNYNKLNILQMQLYSMTRFVELELYRANIAQGFDDIQNSFVTVLSNISNAGTRIADLATACSMSKQNISIMVSKIIECGYLEKVPDLNDKRSQQLVFSGKGKKLIINSMNNLSQIEQQLVSEMGHKAYENLQLHGARLWQYLGGSGPQTIASDEREMTIDDTIIDDWVRVLYLALRQEEQADLERYFVHSEQGIYLNPRLTQLLLQRPALNMTKADEKRVISWLKAIMKRSV